MTLKKKLKKIVLDSKIFRKPSIAYCSEHGLLPSVFVRTPSNSLREIFRLPESTNITQLNQDIFALIENRFDPGFFVEIGANDGFSLSNTLYLEEHFGWTGLLVEANPKYYESLKGRKAKPVMAAVTKEPGFYDFCDAGLYGGLENLLDGTHEKMTKGRNSIKVKGATLRQVLSEGKAPANIDFISIDVEGAEVPIVEQMCELDDYRFSCGCIEHNSRESDYQKIRQLLEAAEYRIVWADQTCHDLFFIDRIRVNKRAE